MPHRALARATQAHPFLMSLLILLVIVVPGFWRTQVAIDKATDASVVALRAATENKSNAIVNCQNANDQREANKTLWLFVLSISAANQTREQTPREKLITEKFKGWVVDLYAPRDCSRLDKKYTIPPPPDIPGLQTP